MKKTLFYLIILLSMPLASQNMPTVVDTMVVLKKLLPDSVVVSAVEKPVEWEVNSNVTMVIPVDVKNLIGLYRESALESKTVQGYVIQVYYGRLQRAREIKDAFLELYPDEIVEIEYDNPDYKVFVGQYIDANVARAALVALKARSSEYSGAFVRPKEIKIYDQNK